MEVDQYNVTIEVSSWDFVVGNWHWYTKLLMQHYLAAVVLETTNQQLTALKEGDDPLATTGTEADDSDIQQGLEETRVSDSGSSIPLSVDNGESIIITIVNIVWLNMTLHMWY